MTEPSSLPRARGVRVLLLPWWSVLGLLLPLELVGVTVAFDAPLTFWDRVGGPAAWLFHAKHELSYFLVTSLAAGLMLGGSALLDQLRGQLTATTPERPGLVGGAWLLAHGVAFAGFFALTGLIFGSPPESWDMPGLLFAAWFGLGAAVLATWCLAALPGRSWWTLIRERHRALLVGVILGAFAAVVAPYFERVIWGQLDRLTLRSAHLLLQNFGKTMFDPERQLLGIAPFAVTISPQCSGIEGILLIWVFLGGYLWFWRESLRFPRAFLLIPLATVVIWCLNALRIVALILLGRYVSEEMALKSFHSQAGWIAFNVVALGLVWGTQSLGYFRKPDRPAQDAGADEGPNPVVVYVAPFTAIVATTMVTSAVATGGFDGLYALRVLAAGAMLWCLRRRPSELRWKCSWDAVGIGVLVFGVWMAVEWWLGMGDGSALRARLISLPPALAATWLFFRVVGSVILVPVAEELAFRGFLVRRLISADFDSVSPRRFTWFSFLGSSLLFGSLHGPRWFAGMLAGMLYAMAVYRRGELADAVLAHAVTNGLIAAAVLIGGAWGLWG